MSKLFIIVNQDSFFLSHRKEIALVASQNNYEVTIVANDTGYSDAIKALGLNFINLPINKTGTNIKEEFCTFKFLYKLFKVERPNIVHFVGLKTIIWGGIAARLTKIKGYISAVSGLGVTFSPEYKKKYISLILIYLLKFIHNRKNVYCIFHNMDDMNLFVSRGIIKADRCYRTMGSGINLKEYEYFNEPKEGKIKILFTARMVEDKGVLTLINAANILRNKYENLIEFILCGGLETNPLAITKEKLGQLCDNRYIKWLGKRNDILEQLKQSHIFAFPSYYKEGLPKSCIEAAAIGRPIITCNSTGCKDTVIDGETGFLIPIKDENTLADKIKYLIDNPNIRVKMGIAARKYAENTFAIEKVIETHLHIYNQCLNTDN